MKGVVEWVRDGRHVRVQTHPNGVVPEAYNFPLTFTGIQVDLFKRQDGGSREEVPEGPLAIPAKVFVEMRMLGRTVDIRLETCENGRLHGSVYHPRGLISLFLVQQGLAKLLGGSRDLETLENPQELRDAQREAQKKRIGRWASSSGGGDEFKGKIVEIISGDCVMVLDSASNEERRVFLAWL